MFVSGIEISAAAAGLLALLLHRANHVSLSEKVGIAVDTNTRAIKLTSAESKRVLDVLADPPAGLADLRAALLRARRPGEQF